MATNHTENYQLNLWESTDKFSREEINENTQKLDAAVKAETDARAALAQTVAGKADAAALAALTQAVAGKGNCSIITGCYIGTGGYGPEHPNVLEFPNAERPPRVVIVLEGGGPRRTFLIRGITKTEVYSVNTTHTLYVEWTDKGVKWYGSDDLYQLNYIRSDQTYQYFYAAFF